jgi:HEAT repeat protein
MPTTPEFDVILERLRDTSGPVSAANLYHLSDLSRADLAALEAVWADLPAERRQSILQDLSEIAEANFEVNFEAVLRLGLEDETAEARATAIRALWEAEDPTLIAPFIDFMKTDPDAQVRAAAASALGRFVYLGEVEELPEAQARRVEDALLEVARGADEVDVRRRALEAVAFATRSEVGELIVQAYASPDPLWRASAVFAMGRTADAKWAPQVHRELHSTQPEMRFEAARAAGELELADTAGELAQLTHDVDLQVRDAAIWSLGQIGGDFARETLTRLLERASDEDEQDFIQEALDNLEFTDEVNAFSMFELGLDDDDQADDDQADDGEDVDEA